MTRATYKRKEFIGAHGFRRIGIYHGWEAWQCTGMAARAASSLFFLISNTKQKKETGNDWRFVTSKSPQVVHFL